MNMTQLIIASATKIAEKQAEDVKAKFIAHIQSEEFEIALAEKLDAKINIPFTSDERESELFRDFVDVVTDIVAGLLGEKK